MIEPILLINCGHTVCKKCVLKDDLKEIKCKICGLVSQQDFNETQASNATQQLLKVYFEDIFKILESETSLKLNELKGMLTTKWFNWNKSRLHFNSFLEKFNLQMSF